MKIKIFSDGGSRGNPGEAAIGVVIINYEDGTEIKTISKRIGKATNNIAEYTAVLEGAMWVSENIAKPVEVEFVVDSELIGKQLRGEYRVKDQNLKEIYLKIREIIIELGGRCSFTIVRREKNRQADELVNRALDT